MNMLTIPMEELQYKKINGTLIVDTLNHAPIQMTEVQNQESMINEPFSLTLPDNLFIDFEGDPVVVTVTSTSGGALTGMAYI